MTSKTLFRPVNFSVFFIKELFENKFKNLIQTSKFKFSFQGLQLQTKIYLHVKLLIVKKTNKRDTFFCIKYSISLAFPFGVLYILYPWHFLQEYYIFYIPGISFRSIIYSISLTFLSGVLYILYLHDYF
jgi:hypothetical protein